MTTEQIIIYGAGGFARELAWFFESARDPDKPRQVVCFVDDNPLTHGTLINNIPAMDLLSARGRFPGAKIVLGIGASKTRQILAERVVALGFEFATFIHPRVEIAPWVEVGEGTVICPGCTLTTNIKIGRHVQINVNCSITHDDILDDYTTLAPGVHVSGAVHLGQRAYVGTGAVIINGTLDQPLIIGDDAVIGAGACVVKSVPPGITVVGVPARPLSKP